MMHAALSLSGLLPSRQLDPETQRFLLKRSEEISPAISTLFIDLANMIKMNSTQLSFLFLEFKHTKQISKGPICCDLLSRTGRGYKCFECMAASSSCICEECFIGGNHAGHNYHIFDLNEEGCCDCGNEEAWSDKGFCKNHGKNYKPDYKPISEEDEKAILNELQFLFYLYFCLQQQIPNVSLNFGILLFQWLLQFNQDSHTSKIITSKVFLRQFNDYPDLKTFKKSTIMKKFFNLEVDEDTQQVLESLTKLCFELFPIIQIRRQICINYVQMQSSQDKYLTSSHPLGLLNFQFLSSVKTLTSLLNEKRIKPLTINFNKFKSTQEVCIVYQKFYEDFDYICNMKENKAFFQIQLMHENIGKFGGFRRHIYQIFNNEGQIDNLGECLMLQEICLKTLGRILSKLKQEKPILKKCIKQLYASIKKNSDYNNDIHFVEERMFALFFFTYTNGLETMKPQNINEFLELLDENQQSSSTIQKLAEISFVKMIKINSDLYFKEKLAEQGSYISYLARQTFPQTKFMVSLDCIYNKILLYLDETVSKKSVYEMNFINEFMERPIDEIGQIWFELFYLNEAILDCYMTKLDEMIIASFLQIDRKAQIIALYSSVVATYKNVNVKELKTKCFNLVHSEKIFQEFITKYVCVSGGKVTNKSQVSPLCNESQCSFRFAKMHAFLKLNKDQILIRTTPLQFSAQFSKILSDSMINMILKFLKELSSIQSLEDQEESIICLCLQTMVMYYLTKSQKLKNGLISISSHQNLLDILPQKLKLEILSVTKSESEYKIQEEKQINQTMMIEEEKKATQMNKKNLKFQKLKKMQEKSANHFKKQMSIENDGKQEQICIICKKNDQNSALLVMCSLQFSNIFTIGYFDEAIPYLCFDSCDHKIHGQCYNLGTKNRKFNQCYLCKREIDCLIDPIPSNFYLHDEPSVQAREKAKNIINILAVASSLLEKGSSNSMKSQETRDIFSEIYESIIFQIVGCALSDQSAPFLKKSTLIIYQQLLEALYLNQAQIPLNKNIAADICTSQVKRTAKKHELLLVQYVENRIKSTITHQNFQNNALIQAIPQDWIIRAETILSNLRQQASTITQLPPLRHQPSSYFKLIALPSDLCQLHILMGKCPQCQAVTNKIFVCMICEWRSCQNCEQALKNHHNNNHCSSSIYIRADCGQILFSNNQQSRINDQYLYLDYMGEMPSDYSQMKPGRYTKNVQLENQLAKKIRERAIRDSVWRIKMNN